MWCHNSLCSVVSRILLSRSTDFPCSWVFSHMHTMSPNLISLPHSDLFYLTGDTHVYHTHTHHSYVTYACVSHTYTSLIITHMHITHMWCTRHTRWTLYIGRCVCVWYTCIWHIRGVYVCNTHAYDIWVISTHLYRANPPLLSVCGGGCAMILWHMYAITIITHTYHSQVMHTTH